MSEQDKLQEVTDDIVVSMDYTLTVDGDVLELNRW